MALDESVRTFVDELLELRLIDLRTQGGGSMPTGIVKMRLARLWSFGGLTRGGVGRIESPEHPLSGFWITFSNPKSDETCNFTDKLGRYQIHLSSEEPGESSVLGVPSPRSIAGGFGQISAMGFGPVPARYPKPSPEIVSQLEAIPVSVNWHLAYRPCDVILKDGRRIDRVYVVPEEPYILTWGVWPEDDNGKASIRVEAVMTVQESRHRLPAPLATKLYAAGESGMGYTIFTVVFDDGSQIAFQTGNAIDFIDYPAGKGPTSVVDVLPHVGREAPLLRRAPAYCWCLYSD